MKAKIERVQVPRAAWAVFEEDEETNEGPGVATLFVGPSALARAIEAAVNSEEPFAIAWPVAFATSNVPRSGAEVVFQSFAEELEPDSDATRGEAVLVLASRVGLEPRAWFDEPGDEG